MSRPGESMAGSGQAPIPLSAVQAARIEAARTQRPLVAVLETRLGLTPPEFAASLSASFGCPWLEMADLRAAVPAWDLLPYTEAVRQGCLLLRRGDLSPTLVLADPFDAGRWAWADARIASAWLPALARQEDIAACLSMHEERQSAFDSAAHGLQQTGETAGDENLSLFAISEDPSPVVRLVHSTLYDALGADASDIHLECGQNQMVIRYRMDGVLTTAGTVPGQSLAEQVISRIKVMAELDISERRIPQDGRFRLSVRGREIDFRVSIMPSLHGEDAVVRILDKQAISRYMNGIRLESLGFDAADLVLLRRLANEPYGMFLVTGPTGSGKTTTLYAALSEINHGRDKIVTIEDPVEYQLANVLQIPVNEKKGLTFARGLRSILRHDPDRIMVGEIRDPETAQIAVQSALTGHLVFTTVHANNVFDVIGRFLHMGVEPASFISALNGVVAQRLVRKLCPSCAGAGCSHCRGSGYRGRKAIAEILLMSDTIREMILSRAPVRVLREAAAQQGTRSLRAAALACVEAGETTLQEIDRVTTQA